MHAMQDRPCNGYICRHKWLSAEGGIAILHQMAPSPIPNRPSCPIHEHLQDHLAASAEVQLANPAAADALRRTFLLPSTVGPLAHAKIPAQHLKLSHHLGAGVCHSVFPITTSSNVQHS